MSLENSSGTRRWKRYPKYKDSGVEWLGEVPEGWRLIKTKWLFKEIVDRNHPNEPLLSVTQQNSVVTRAESDIRVWNPTEDISGYKFVKKGDFVISLRSFQGGIEFSTVQGIVSPAYIVIRKKKAVCENYFRFLFKSEPFVSILDISTTGIRQGKNIGYEDFSNIFSPELQQKECDSIVALLDYETARIDDLIVKKKRQVELLQEKRGTLISHAVTKGLNPNIEMKDSGVAWITEVPKPWHVLLMKRIVELKHGHQFRENDFVYSGIPVVKITELGYDEKLDLKNPDYVSSDRIKEFQEFLISKNSVLMALTGGTIGKTIWVQKNYGNILQNYRVGKFLPKKGSLSLRFLFYSLLSDFIQNQIFLSVAQNAQPNLGKEEFDNFVIFIPPLSEQFTITTFLDNEIIKIDNLIDVIKNSTGKLYEYRTALISAAVTGKIDVRQEISS